MAHPLLWETGTREQSIEMASWEELPVFFTVDKGSELTFDPFALVFYLVSRYEEYLPFQPDEHGRFPATASLAYRERFLDIPLVDLVGRKFRLWLAGQFPRP